MRVRLAVVAALLVTLFVGRLWGVSGRWALDRAPRDAAVRVTLLEAHASPPGARARLCKAESVPQAHAPTLPVKISEKP
jgi:hypothetical protein